MHKVISTIVAILAYLTAAQSGSILGVGMWFWIIIAAGTFVGISQYSPPLRNLGSAVAGLLSTISLCAVALGLIAATIGGSFRLGDDEGLLLFLFGLIVIFGFTLVFINKKDTTFKGG